LFDINNFSPLENVANEEYLYKKICSPFMRFYNLKL